MNLINQKEFDPKNPKHRVSYKLCFFEKFKVVLSLPNSLDISVTTNYCMFGFVVFRSSYVIQKEQGISINFNFK